MDGRSDVARRARAALELLRPHPHRGDVIAAGAVPLAVALLLIDVRLGGPWGSGILLVLEAAGAALLLGMSVLAPREGERPRVYEVVLQLAGLAVLLVALWRLADVLGVDDPLERAGTLCWIFAAFTGAAAWLATRRRSAPCAFVAALGGIVAVLAFVEWVFDPDGAGTARWLLLALALGFAAGALTLRDRRRRESVYLVDAAGVAVVVLALTWVGAVFLGALTFDGGPPATPGAGWKLVLAAAGLGLIAYGAVDREPGPAWLGALVLALFVLLVGAPGEDGPSLWFWPLALLLAGGALIAVGLRPRVPLPPEPPRPGGPGVTVRGPFPDGPSSPSRGALWSEAARAADPDAPTAVRRPADGDPDAPTEAGQRADSEPGAPTEEGRPTGEDDDLPRD